MLDQDNMYMKVDVGTFDDINTMQGVKVAYQPFKIHILG
jgi:hypothetical protein